MAAQGENGALPEYGSDVLVDALIELGVGQVAFTPGATFRGVHDSLVHRPSAPEIVLCLHEEISVAVAHGYAKATGQLMAVALHNVVGLQHAAMAVYNAWCDRVPILLLGGTGPVDAAVRRPWIDGIHTGNLQAGQVRDYTKWDDQPASLAAALQSLVRACRLAEADPPGPVYVCLDSQLQEDRVAEPVPRLEAARYASPSRPGPEPAVAAVLAAGLTSADWPQIVVSRVDREQAAVDALVELAELLAVPVCEPERDYGRPALCFPTDHWLNFTGVPLPVPADAVLALDVGDIDEFESSTTAAWVGEVSPAPLRARGAFGDLQRIQPTSVSVQASVAATIPAVLEYARRLLAADPDAAGRVQVRRQRLSGLVERQRKAWAAEAAQPAPNGAISRSQLARAIGAAIAGRPWVLANGGLHNWVHRLWPIGRVDAYLGDNGGAGLGYGLGASIGAALAYRGTQTIVVDIQSDGDALMTPSALWTAARYQVPLLVVLDNNRQYENSVRHAERIARTRVRSADRALAGTGIDDPAVDFAGLAQAFGVPAVGPVSTPGRLLSVLHEAAERVVRDQTPMVIDVLTGVD